MLEPLKLFWGLVNIPRWGYMQVYTIAQIELLSCDVPLVVYKSSTVAKDKKHTRKEMENLTRIWEEKKRKEQGKKFDLNDFLRTGKLK